MGLAFCLRQLGSLVHANSGRIILVFTLTLILLSLGLKSASFDSDLNSWIQKSSTIQDELNYTKHFNGDDSGSYSELIIQTPTPANKKSGVLNVDAMMIHLEAMAIANHVSVYMFDVSWTLKDICFRPTLPIIEGYDLNNLLDRMIPCVIKTPLDCFWEGSKLHTSNDIMSGPQTSGDIKKWIELDPISEIEKIQSSRPHASNDYQSLLLWMERVGIKHGYQRKPCLDPTDPNCPDSSPNKHSKTIPNIGQQLTGGCYGVVENQMHWREEEIVGGSVKNQTGYIIKAEAIQSSIPLMCEQDLYDYWSKTSKTSEIREWSVEKAKTILEAWGNRFKDELDLFTKSVLPSQTSQQIHSISSKSMLEPIDTSILLDYTNFLFSFSLMTIITCISFPKFAINSSNSLPDEHLENNKQVIRTAKKTDNSIIINVLGVIQLALACSMLVGLTFVASLGFCSFLDLPFNMATTQILPPLALYYGFNQLNSIVSIYSQKFGDVPIDELTTSCLTELLPILLTESKSHFIALLVPFIIPIPATRSLAIQAIAHILLATAVNTLLLPAIMTNFLCIQYYRHVTNCVDNDVEGEGEQPSNRKCLESTGVREVKSSNSKQKCSFRSESPCSFISARTKSAKQTGCDNSVDVDQILSRIQDDLKNIQVDSRNTTPTDLNFTNLNDDTNLETSFNYSMRTPRSPVEHQIDRTNLMHSSIKNTSISHSNPLPDLILSNAEHRYYQTDTFDESLKSKYCAKSTISECSTIDIGDFDKNKGSVLDEFHCDNEDMKDQEDDDYESKDSYLDFMIKKLILNKYIKIVILLIKLSLLVLLIIYGHPIKYGLQLKDIVAQETEQYASYSAQERYFSIYNIFIITKDNFDYPSEQRLLHRYYKSMSNVEGIVKDKNVNRFWLVAFREWLLELQHKFDIDKSKRLVSSEGYSDHASEATKLAFKLLAQTGQSDNPIDKSLITTNRLVDSNGIINQKAFYHYLTAWVSYDSSVYTFTEANFKPEPKMMKDDLRDLRIEKARPLTYTQIPFLMKLSKSEDSLRVVSKIRSMSKNFEELNLPNFPTGTPFIFWDQFINLDSFALMAIMIVISTIFLVILIMSSEFNTAAIMTIPMILTLIELYCFTGLLKIPFNNLLAVLMISSIGIMIGQSVHYVSYFGITDGDSTTSRILEVVTHKLVVVITNLALLFVCVLVFLLSKIDFINNFSYLLLALFMSNLFNSILLIPILLSLFGPNYKPDNFYSGHFRIGSKNSEKSNREVRRSKNKPVKSCSCDVNEKRSNRAKGSVKNSSKRRKQILDYQRKVQSEQSLSTISEEP